MARFIPFTHPGAVGVTTSVYEVTREAEIIRELDPSSYGSIQITCNENAAIKRTLKIDLNYGVDLEPFSNFVMPVVSFTDPEDNYVTGPQGVYMVMPSSTTIGPSSVAGTIEGRDLAQILVMSSLANLRCLANVDRGNFIRDLALEAGFFPEQVNIPQFDVVQPEERVWDPGETRMTAMTDIANSSSWYQPWFDNRGHLITRPYRPLTELPPAQLYTNETDYTAKDLRGLIKDEPDWTRLSNSVTVRKIGSEDDPTISYTARNMNASSPSSIPALGMELNPKVIDDPDILALADAQTRAEALLSESASHYRTLSLSTLPLINADLHQVVELYIAHGDTILIEGTFWRTGYTFTLKGSNVSFVQDLARVEPWI